MIPNVNSSELDPVCFEALFSDGKDIFKYSLSILLEEFANKKQNREVVSEELTKNRKQVFIRNGSDRSALNLSDNYQFQRTLLPSVTDNLVTDELFLTNGFKSIYDKFLAKVVIEWFRNLKIYSNFERIQTAPVFSNPSKDIGLFGKYIKAFATDFGVFSNEVEYRSDTDDSGQSTTSLYSIINSTSVKSELYESLGTLKFTNIIPIIVDTLRYGKTLIVDEFDASIHPKALMSIINIFHDTDINKNNAQLIFNTHNPIFLSQQHFRRDEIKFVERNSETGTSEIYSLADFGTGRGSKGRKTNDYMKNYFIGRYGAISDIDFSETIEAMLEEDSNE